MAVPSARPSQLEWRLWPPSADTRAVVAEKMVHHLISCAPPIEKDEAVEHCKRIEEEAFKAAEKQKKPQLDGDDAARADSAEAMSKVRLYAHQASQLLLDTMKAQRKAQSLKDTVFDISGQKRDFLTKEVAGELFKSLKEPGNAVRRICLSNWSFGKDAALLAGEVLASVKGNLDDVNLADIVAGRPEAEALEVMGILSEALAGSRLESLNLSDNALGAKGVRAFSALLKSQKSLQRLYFMNNGISEEAAQAICELLPSPQDLRTLHFHNNMSGDGGAQALSVLIAKAPLLLDFQFSSTRVASDGGVALAEALQAGVSLRRIDLRDNMFGPEVGVKLASTLRLHPDLTEVYLSDLGLEDEGAIALANALEEGAPDLKVLDLGGNEITVKAAPSIAACVKSKQNLSRLNLTENELKDRGAVIICEALKSHTSLSFLDLSSNQIRDGGANAAVRVVQRSSSARSSTLEVHLERNFLTEDGVESVAKLSGKGEVLYLSDQEDEDDEDGDENDGGSSEGDEDSNEVDEGDDEEEEKTLQSMNSLKV